MDKKSPKRGLLDQVRERLRNPGQLRAALTVGMILLGYAGIYLPLNADMTESRSKLLAEQKRLVLAQTVESLRGQYDRFKTRLTGKTDPNEWVQYVLDGIRARPVKLVALDARPPQDVGPYKAVALRIELEGHYAELHEFLAWLEANERLMRVDSVSLNPHRQRPESLVLQVNLLGLMG